MTDAAYKVWEAFKSELIVEPTDDMKEALATAIREVINQLQQNPGVIMCADVLELCEEIEKL
jgi:hypothetical protein